MRGRKPKPTALKIITGNPGHRPLNDDEPRPPRDLPQCPEHLDAEARAEWDRVVSDLFAAGVLTRVDRAALAAYCSSYSLWVRAEAMIRASGEVIKAKGSDKIVVNPYVYVRNTALRQMHSFASEFGLTPASRSRIRVAAAAVDDPFEEFLRKGATAS